MRGLTIGPVVDPSVRLRIVQHRIAADKSILVGLAAGHEHSAILQKLRGVVCPFSHQ